MPKIAEGDRVTKGQPLSVIEAMKMESTVSSPADGVVAELAVAAGANVEVGDLLVVLGE
jgi:biotin carboxyl carrier protein